MRQKLLPFFDWYAHTSLAHTMSDSKVLIATAQIVHLVGMTLLIGTIMMVDLTLLGFGIKRHPASRVAEELTPWTAGGLAIMFVTGPLNLASESIKCYNATFFWVKMGLLILAIVFQFTVHKRVATADPPVSKFQAGLVACVSLALWFGVALAAKFIGFIGDDLRDRAGPF
ncbi:MAG TPA: DUF6644 family protein [Bryobacteraceae bacterium]|nr:DUF6644 family protein [Bryobacteraceae bacterium]